MWVIRAGQNSLHYDKYITSSKVFIPWDGYKLDLSTIESLTDFRDVVKREKCTDKRTSVSNWAIQLFTFTHEIHIGDYVLIPSRGSRTYCLAKITSGYCFNPDEKDSLYHCRDIEIEVNDIPRGIFSQTVIHSLGAFRTIFKTKYEDEILKTIDEWKEAQG